MCNNFLIIYHKEQLINGQFNNTVLGPRPKNPTKWKLYIIEAIFYAFAHLATLFSKSEAIASR
jgi:hypothetical protein